jgi:hypothetical protein
MPKYAVTVYRVAADLMKGIIEVEAATPEEAKIKARANYEDPNKNVLVDWDCIEPDWAEENNGWIESLFEVEELE